MLILHKIKVLHAVSFPIVFLLFCERDWQRGLFKVMKNDHFLAFLAVWTFFPNFLGR